jgi:hypothetical protein
MCLHEHFNSTPTNRRSSVRTNEKVLRFCPVEIKTGNPQRFGDSLLENKKENK